MTEKIHIRAYAEVTFRVPQDRVLDLEEYREWCDEGGDVLVSVEAEDLLDYLLQTNDRDELLASFGKIDPDLHEVMESGVCEVEILKIVEES